ncbi:MAG: patatin-like phospholipase family protein [Bacteroidales bacterium]|nr:patatin-like phospholipase family protein [Bacteroidales bacterium]MDZ4203726.1 patatin-like phospholipase family protein [Bacteroidales bacterium]
MASTFSCFVYGQKVGVVLSGGGAKGVAHIGVLRALEEEGIPIHYIAGTSMGAIIGGLYAIGWTTEEMERVVLSDDFQQWSTGTIGDEYKYYFKEPSPNASWVNFKVRIDSVVQPRLPVNIVSPVQMDFVFLELFAAAAAAANYDFDSLFLPYRCIASDVEASKAVVLENGDLGSAIRASMTFPFYFRPIRIDGKMMFDGGMYNNFPVDVMYKDFFPDMIIGSKTATNFGKIKDDDILSHLEAMLTEVTDFEIPCESGVLIQPKLKNVSVIDFSHTQAFIDSGYVATKRAMSQIRAFVYDTLSQKVLNERRQAYRKSLSEVVVNKIYINGISEEQSLYVRRLLKFGEDKLPIEIIKREYFKMITDGQIEHIFPRLSFNDTTGLFDLYLDVTRDKDLIVEFGGNVSSSTISSAFIGLKYKFLGNKATTVSANSYIGRFYSSVSLEARVDFPSKLPLFIQPSFTFNRWDFLKTSTYYFEDETPSYLVQNEANSALAIGVPIKKKGRLIWGINSARLTNEYYQTNFFTRNDTLDKSQFKTISPYVFFEKNTLNDKQYPWEGSQLLASFRYVSGNEKHFPGSTALHREITEDYHEWWQLRLLYQRYFERNGPYTVGAYGELMLSNMNIFSNYTSTMLITPAFQPFPGSKTKFLPWLRAHSYIALGLRNIFTIRRNLDFRIESFLFTPYREIKQNQHLQAFYGQPLQKAYLIGSAALVLHSPIGPLSLSIDHYGKNDESPTIMFNLGYIVFNRRSLQ